VELNDLFFSLNNLPAERQCAAMAIITPVGVSALVPCDPRSPCSGGWQARLNRNSMTADFRGRNTDVLRLCDGCRGFSNGWVMLN
jgi:hypothetical protein